MRAGWNGAAPAELPVLTLRERLRFLLRAVLAGLWLLGMLGVFVIARVINFLLGRSRVWSPEALGPRIVATWARGALPLLGVRLEVVGTPLAAPGVYVANHSSWIDIIVLQATAAPCLVSKAEVRDWPLIGLIGRAIGTLFIERNPSAVHGQAAELRARINAGDHMALFPEGTSSDGQRVLPFRSSLFGIFFSGEPGGDIAVQPVSLHYRQRSDLPPSLYAWWGDMEFAPHLKVVLARSTKGVVQVSFLPPLPVDEMPDRKALARAAEAAVRNEFLRLSASAR